MIIFLEQTLIRQVIRKMSNLYDSLSSLDDVNKAIQAISEYENNQARKEWFKGLYRGRERDLINSIQNSGLLFIK